MPNGIKPSDYGLMMGGLALMQGGNPGQALQTGLNAYNTSAMNQANQRKIAWDNALAQQQILNLQRQQQAAQRATAAREAEAQRLIDLGYDPTQLNYVLSNPDLAKQFYKDLREDQERGRQAAEIVAANPQAFPGQPTIPETAATAEGPRDLGFVYENENLVDQTIHVSPQLLAEGNQAALKMYDTELKRIEKDKEIDPQGAINDAHDLLSLSINPELQTGPIQGTKAVQALQGAAHAVGAADITPENRYVELTNTLALKKLAGTDTGRKALTGAISEKELQFIIDSVPNLRSSKQYIAEYAARTMWASENLKRSRQIDIALRNKQITPEEARAERAKIIREPSEQMKKDLKKIIAASQGEGKDAAFYQGEGGQQALINDIKNLQIGYMNRHGQR